jgi:hypothetical protein
LQLHGDVSDLIEKECAAVRGLETADLAGTAPVKAPFSYPKSSLSSIPKGIAAQFSLRKGRARRLLWA